MTKHSGADGFQVGIQPIQWMLKNAGEIKRYSSYKGRGILSLGTVEMSSRRYHRRPSWKMSLRVEESSIAD